MRNLLLTDLESTKRAIIRACTLPLSIVIVGVGDADFTNMKVLDADYEKLEVKKTTFYMVLGHAQCL